MTNLRILSIEVIDSTTVNASFTEKLSTSINASNIIIESQLDHVPSPLILGISISANVLTLNLQPLTPQAAYIITFQSIPGLPFQSLNGDAILFQDGITNKQLFLGPIEDNNPVQQFLQNYLKDNIYNVSDSNALVYKIIQALSTVLSKALYDIRQVKNENYVSFTVVDEQKIRGTGPFDRLLEESAYEIIRVGRTPTSTPSIMNISLSDFPYYPISLLANPIFEIILLGDSSKNGTFDINNFILTMSNKNVSKLTGLTFFYTDGRAPYVYNIQTLGYQILNSEYDQDFGFSYALLNDFQFKISETILSDLLFSTENIFNIQVNYEFRNLGRVIDPNTVSVNTVLSSIRETLPPIINVFNLKNAPITDSSGNTINIGGISFIDPNALNINTPHPAFVNELPFNLGALPSIPGQYSVDYSSGTVYVYGSDLTNNGTGPFPPLATYNYLYLYKNSLDYTFDSDINALVALPNGNLLNNKGTINFNYEQVLISGVDYNIDAHIEVLSERINNKLLALNVLTAENNPITNVFRVYNETSGEIYGILRWENNKIYFTYNTPPNVDSIKYERASFINVLNETLFVNQSLINSSNITIFKCLLNNNNIISTTEDCISSSINTSINFSNFNIFKFEKWWDGSGVEDLNHNINRLTSIGQYQIDYVNGVIYIAVPSNQNVNIGNVSYKSNVIIPQHPHILSVDDIYYQISILNPKDKTFQYNSFSDGSISPSSFDISDEAFLNNVKSSPYLVKNNQIGAFVNLTFIPGITNNIKFIRGIFEYTDLQNSTNPFNFSESATFSGTIITINPVIKQEFSTVLFDGYYYVNLDLNLPYISQNITLSISIIRISDNKQLWNSSGIITAGNPVRLQLPGINTPVAGDSVIINCSLSINDLSRVIVDYNKGEYYIDYSYLADEIIISYEYGDNVIDFRESQTLSTNDQYYVSYKVGALRDALLKNFGTLINVPELATFDVDFDRERYRDAITGALESFIIGPTVSAMKNLVQAITHVEPEIIELAFQNWSLGYSLLNPRGIETKGEFKLLPAKYGNGVLIDTDGQLINFPISSNFKLEQGSFQEWIIPEWNGIDNDSNLTFTILKNGTPVNSNFVFIGGAEYHPKYNANNQFIINKNSNVIGKPNTHKDGVFIYYDFDQSGLYKRWYLNVVDGYADGYGSDGYSHNYSIKINSTGLFYDVKSLVIPKPSTLIIQSGTNTVNIKITSNLGINEGINFVSDREHYLLDFGESLDKNRFSIFKDVSGYLNLRVYDKYNNSYNISKDISSWKAYEKHHIAASWVINSKNSKDELHLFVDGFEVPNIIRYGNKVAPYLHEKFRTINPEEIAGMVPKNIVSSIDLKTTINSNSVFSSLNFSAYGINVGDTIFIDEIGFNPSGYQIISENGNTLILNASMPATLTNGRFCVNRTVLPIISEIDIYSNIAISTISSTNSGNDLITILNSNSVSSAGSNFIAIGVVPGYLIRINNTLFDKHYVVISVSAHSLILNANMPAGLSALSFNIYPNNPVEIPGIRALRPSYAITQDSNFNNQIVLNNNIKQNDLILITTLGLNHKKIVQNFYSWNSLSNVIKTRMAPPINLNNVGIHHILLPKLLINSTNSTLTGSSFISNSFTTEQPSLSDLGRTLRVIITTTNNLVYPLTVQINGSVNETLTFTTVGSQTTINKFTSITGIVVNGTCINTTKTFLTVEVKEAKSITIPENSLVYPVIRYSYQIKAGTTLSGDGYRTVRDSSGLFNSLLVNNYLVINSPSSVVGTYKIVGISADHLSLTLDTTMPAAFTNGSYQILNTTSYRSGLQNGYFILEKAANPGVPYLLNKGTYEFDYYTYLSMKFDPLNVDAFIGTDLNGKFLLNGIVDEMKITSIKLTDTRVGESIPNNQESITKDFNLIKAQNADINTLMLCHFDSFPFTNTAPFYITSENKEFMQSGVSVNDNFNQSLYITNKPIVIENSGILDSKNEGTIEFWVNPLYDTANDPNYKYYFDAAGIEVEQATSLNDVSVKISGMISKVLSVTLQAGDQTIDYFAGGKVELDTTGAISESVLSLNANTVVVSKKILEVITVKIAGDPTNTNYFGNGTISLDKTTIYLGNSLPENTLSLIVVYKPTDGSSQSLNEQIIRLNRKLPNQNMPVIVTYIPSGLQGDRISIFKDPSGYINFDINASGVDYVVRAPIFWAQRTWHRVKATYSFNGGKGTDTIRMLVDGYECSNILFGTGLIFGDPYVFGSTSSGVSSGIQTNIKFKDFLNEIYVGGDYYKNNGAYALIDNLRISNLARPVFKPFGDSIDVNYNSNINMAFPVTKDLYTTLLLDFETLIVKNEDFITLVNKKSGIFDFTINIFDSFDIVNNSFKVKEVLETLIKILKPASSRVFINYM